MAESKEARDKALLLKAFDQLFNQHVTAGMRLKATQVADTETTVLLTGESGAGKEVVARFIHRASARKGGPFIALNCAALPEQLLESELFGYERGR